MPLHAVVLAAGQGTRMRSRLPKVLQPLGGQPLLTHVLDAATLLSPARMHVVYGHGGDAVRERFREADVCWVHQAEQLGTGHAVQQAMDGIPDDASVLVLYGDVPLVRVDTLERLCDAAAGGPAVLTVDVADPAGYGRIVRDAGGRMRGITEHKDATSEQRAIHEINTGLVACPAGLLRGWLAGLGCDNAQGEYYLTDIVALAVRDGIAVAAVSAASEEEVQGINDRIQLAAAERVLQRRRARALMREGVTLVDPARFDLRGRVTAGRDCLIDVNAVLEGEVRLGDGVVIGPHCVIRNTALGDGVRVEAHSVLDGAELGEGCTVGPFARLRPGTRLAAGARVGNFVEVKQSDVGEGSKINHLSYIGDARIGRDVNVGAGVITCNYDGASKHLTVIGDGVFVGSDCQLVAPVEIGPGATIGAGSTITRTAPEGQLSLSRARQVSVPGWRRPTKKV